MKLEKLDRRIALRVVLPALLIQRIEFLLKELRATDQDELFERAVRVLDVLACARMEGSTIRMHHRDGSIDLVEF